MSKRTLLVFGVLLLTSPAFGQDAVTPARRDKAVVVATRVTTSDTRSVTQVASVFSIEGSTADKKASGQIGFQLAEFTLTLGAEAPLDDSQKRVILADLNGFQNKTTGKAAVMWQHWDISLATFQKELDALCTQGEMDSGNCTYLHIKRLGTDHNASEFDRLRWNALRYLDKGTIYFGGANGQIAPEKFEYLNKSDLSEADEHHTSWSVSGFVGALFPDAVMLSISYKRQVAFKAGDETEVCTPIATLGALQCADKVIGPPGDPKRSNQNAIEVRKYFGQYFAVSPKLTHDWSAKLTGLEVPLYFFRDKDGGLNGGISLGYIFEKKAFTATAFIGQVLGLITR